MRDLRNGSFYIPECSEEKLRELGFRYDLKNSCYSYSFSVMKDGAKSTINAFFYVPDVTNGDIIVSVKTENGESYSPFYRRDNKNFVIVDLIDKRINSKMHNIGIRQRKVEKK